MAAKAAIRNVGRALSYPYALCDKVAKAIPNEIGITIEKSLEISSDLKSMYDSSKESKQLIDYAMQLEGLPLYIGKHAAGVLITDSKGINNYVPSAVSEGAIISQYDMRILEELGLLKMDFLGLKTLTVIDKAFKSIEKNYGIKLDIYKLFEAEDEKPWELVGKGLTDGIFQLEGAGMTQFMKEFSPKNLTEVTAGISLFRPGPICLGN